MRQKAFFMCSNGLGDKFLDVIGVHVLCHYLDYNPKIQFNKSHIEHFDWGTNHYDLRLFAPMAAFSDIDDCQYTITAPNASSSLSPYKTWKFLCDQGIPVSFMELNEKYRELAKNLIRPSPPIEERLPVVLENAYGIHLRKSDKIKSHGCDIRHENRADEFGIITENLIADIGRFVEQDPHATFLVVSEDKAWKKTIEEYIDGIDGIDGMGRQTDKHERCIVLDYSNPQGYVNFESVLDMFALSRCKTILQGVKYSSYSILAALIGQGKLVNYSPALESNAECLIYTWNSAVEINGEYIENPEILSYMTKGVQDFSICPIK